MVEWAAQAASILSISLLLASSVILAVLSAKAKNVWSFQFQMLIFTIVFSFSEIPKFLGELGLLDIGSVGTYGLVIHTISMFYLAGFVLYRTYRAFKG